MKGASGPARKRGRLMLVGFATGLLALAAGITAVVAKQRAAPPSPPRTRYVDCTSPSLGGKLPAVVYLPAGYDNASLHYPVIYFLHGLPASPTSYEANAFVAQAIAAIGHKAIPVVAPQGARADGDDREYLDWGPTENWPQAIAADLPLCIDSHFHTIKSRTGRALIGLSAGGFGAFNIGLRRLDTFATVESWSGYFEATDPTGLTHLAPSHRS